MLQQSAFQRVLIKNANNVRFTSAATHRPESRRAGEEGRFSYSFRAECVRQRKREKMERQRYRKDPANDREIGKNKIKKRVGQGSPHRLLTHH